MSRSYKKTGASSICSSHTDKSDRNIYHRAERRKTKILLNEEIKFGIEKPFTYDKDICTLCIDSQSFNDYDIPYEKYGVSHPNYNFDVICCCETIEERPSDKIITKGIDYSLPMSDRWSWGSDGGSYWQANKESMRRKFNQVVFGLSYRSWKWVYYSFPKNEVWNDYLYFREAAQNKKHSYYKWRELWNGEKWLQHIRGLKTANSDWNLIEMLFYRRMIPFSFWGPADLIQWLIAHEEEIIYVWFKLCYLRK